MDVDARGHPAASSPGLRPALPKATRLLRTHVVTVRSVPGREEPRGLGTGPVTEGHLGASGHRDMPTVLWLHNCLNCQDRGHGKQKSVGKN